MIKAIIVDDEQGCINTLCKYLEPFKDDIEIVGTYTSPISALEKIKELSPQLLLLDNKLNSAHFDGIKLARECKGYFREVIFLTRYSNLAIEAINEVQPIGYLKKPFYKEDLKYSLNKLIEKAKKEGWYKSINDKSDVQTIQSDDLQENQPKKYEGLSFRNTEGFHFIPFVDIIMCEAQDNYTCIHGRNKRKITVAKTLKDIQQELPNNLFFRTHDSFVVNPSFFIRYDNRTLKIILLEECKASLSRSKKEDFFNLFKKH